MSLTRERGKKMILSIKNITKKFGGVTAVNNCSFEVKTNSLTGLIGPNGSGKTTLFNLILNHFRPDSGAVYFKNELISGMKPYQLSRLGIGRTFQRVRVFRNLTLAENLQVAGLSLPGENDVARFQEMLELVGLTQNPSEFAGNLSYGEQKLLELAMSLHSEPELLLLDEPVAGLNPDMVSKFEGLIQDLKAAGKTLVLIEHNVPFITSCCDDIIVLDRGTVITQGPPNIIQSDEAVIEAYLGSA